MDKLLGPTLTNGTSLVPLDVALGDAEYVAIYFSAQ
jgi:hypothetical protein